MDITINGKTANGRARYRDQAKAKAELLRRGVSDMIFLSIAGVSWVYWYQAR